MKRLCLGVLLAWTLLGTSAATREADDPSFTRREDVIYGRKFGTALTMDVITPKKDANGAAIIVVISGGWFSAHEFINPAFASEYLKRGYTVFAVVHGCQPKFTVTEILEDMHRAVRFIRYHAKDYKIDPDRIGITGGSAGGHLSLMQGTAGNKGKPDARDPIDRVSSRVQAVACFFPPADFLNYGKEGFVLNYRTIGDPFKPALAFQEIDKELKVSVLITDEKKLREIARRISPITHVTADTPPTLIVHGDADKLVPIQQAEVMVAKLKETGVPARLIVKKGEGHGWKGMDKDAVTFADWFDKYLLKKERGGEGQ